MARVLIAWEMGEGYGHLAEIVPLARALRDLGHEVSLALRDLSYAAATAGAAGFPYYQAPLCIAPLPSPPEISYAQILTRLGYGQDGLLSGLVRAWLNLLARLAPDLIVAEFAPTALLAARVAGVPAVPIGTGFSVPPALVPIPTLRPWVGAEAAALVTAEDRTVAAINRVMGELGATPLGTLADLHRGAMPILHSFPELDHYGARGNAAYLGPFADLGGGVAPLWPGTARPRIFAYLNADYPLIGKLLAALDATKAAVLVHLRGAARMALAPPSASIRFEPQPVAVAEALRSCDLVLSHGGHGLTAATLIHGRSLVVCPTQAEQALLGYRLHHQSLAIYVESKEDGVHFLPALAKGLDRRTVRKAADAFAAKHGGHRGASAAARAAALCVSLCSG